MFKLALTAGHYKYTSGKRCLKSLDPKETREWELNARIAEKVEKLLANYTGWELLRTDDRTGEKDISLDARTSAANKFDADFYLSIHHNAGVKGGSGGGIVAFVYTSPSSESVEWQKALYNALISKTGLKGNRATPLAKANFAELRKTAMPAVLLELGFMDSTTDVPIILSEDYADKCASAIVSVLVERGGLKKKKSFAETDNENNPASKVDYAKEYSEQYKHTYVVTASGLNLRRGAGTTKGILKVLKKGEEVNCYGYYTKNGSTVWLYVKDDDGVVGYCSKDYLKVVR